MLVVAPMPLRVLMRLASIGVRRLADRRERDPWELMAENQPRGRPTRWRAPLPVQAPQDLFGAANRETAAARRYREHG